MQLSTQYLSSMFAWMLLAVILVSSVFGYTKFMITASTTLYVKSYALLLMTELCTASASPEGTEMIIPTKLNGLPEDTEIYIIQTEKYRQIIIKSTYKNMFGKNITRIYTFPFPGIFATHYDPNVDKYFYAYDTQLEEKNNQYLYCTHSPYSTYTLCEDLIKETVYNDKYIIYNSTNYADVKWMIKIPKKYVHVKKVDGLLVIIDGKD